MKIKWHSFKLLFLGIIALATGKYLKFINPVSTKQSTKDTDRGALNSLFIL